MYDFTQNHVGQQEGLLCFTFQGSDRFGAIVLQPTATFDPKKVRLIIASRRMTGGAKTHMQDVQSGGHAACPSHVQLRAARLPAGA